MLWKTFKSRFTSGKLPGFKSGKYVSKEAYKDIMNAQKAATEAGQKIAPEFKLPARGETRPWEKLTLLEALNHDIVNTERKASRKLNNLVGIPSITKDDNRLVRHLKNSTAGYGTAAIGVGGVVAVKHFKKEK